MSKLVVVNRAFLDALIEALLGYGYRVLGPVLRNDSIVIDDLASTADMPVGWTDEQSPGNYRVRRSADDRLFGWTVSPASPKALLFPPHATVWQRGADGALLPALLPGITRSNPRLTGDDRHPLALVGIRPCEAAALQINDAVFMKGRFPDPFYCEQRSGMFMLVAECASSNASCFCTSMGTGPGMDSGFDLAVTEMLDEDGEYTYFLRTGSQRGEELFTAVAERTSSTGAGIDPSPGVDAQGSHSLTRSLEEVLAKRDAQLQQARELQVGMHPRVAELLRTNLDHPIFTDIAGRCLACGNCTSVCPTCFCSDVVDKNDVHGTITRERSWSSCFNAAHSELHGQPVRNSVASRYRQWLTHKFSNWYDQFGTSGCVGCGRCITWCPVGIDVRQEVAAIASTGGMISASPGSEGTEVASTGGMSGTKSMGSHGPS